MLPILMRCRDAEMMGPVCDVLSEDKPIAESIRDMRIMAKVHNEPEITDNDIGEIEELVMGPDSCCDEECCI
jgi:hypothetical protein